MKIPFHRPFWSDLEEKNLIEVISHSDGSGDGCFTGHVQNCLGKMYGTDKVLLTGSASLALEMAIRLTGLQPGDEVIMPSFNFPSAANSVLLAGGVPVFVETGLDLMIDSAAVRRAVTERTKGILLVHYAGAAAELEDLMALAQEQKLWIVEDAAQGFGVKDNEGNPVGTRGDFGVVSFHGTKVVSGGEGGALIVNQKSQVVWERALRMHQKGTNRNAFLQGTIDRYSWQGIGMSACPSEFQMAVLDAQLEKMDEILEKRRKLWHCYQRALAPFMGEAVRMADKVSQNGHIFWLCFKEAEKAKLFQSWMREHGIAVYSHFVPLHTTEFGMRFRGNGQPGLDEEASLQDRVMRLPIYPSLKEKEQNEVIRCVKDFLKENLK
ncbi:dTDP-4-amino-4,6-dideoxygalactose transaminase [Gottschalkiaceae bacterium SANA]|nr:dTDP-4-amino-4,6-dideoxygalactose transaminase [Gottschalkiaceae bacterium SANA]